MARRRAVAGALDEACFGGVAHLLTTHQACVGGGRQKREPHHRALLSPDFVSTKRRAWRSYTHTTGSTFSQHDEKTRCLRRHGVCVVMVSLSRVRHGCSTCGPSARLCTCTSKRISSYILPDLHFSSSNSRVSPQSVWPDVNRTTAGLRKSGAGLRPSGRVGDEINANEI